MTTPTLSLLERSRQTIETLWSIIDDIDTYGDAAKGDDKAYRLLVELRQKERWSKTDIATDGYIFTSGVIKDLEAAIAAERKTLVPFYRLTENQKPVALVSRKDLEKLALCNGMSVWAESVTCHEDNEGTVEMMDLVAVYLRADRSKEQAKPQLEPMSDTTRLDYLLWVISGREFKRVGIIYSDGDDIRKAIDNARAIEAIESIEAKLGVTK